MYSYRSGFISREGSGGRNRQPLAAALRCLAPCLLLAGCISDRELLAENSTLAMRMVQQRASSELGCATIRQTIKNEQEEPGQPLGELDSEYHIRAEGCGKEAAYVVLCGDEKLCYFSDSQ
jgi:hypothetical protein